MLLKGVFDYSLEEIAELVDSSVGGVKAALNRGRTKLATSPGPSRSPRATNEEVSRLLRLYVERFNRRDWNGLRELVRADARVRVLDRFRGQLSDSPYFGVYERRSFPWRLVAGEVDGEPAIIALRLHESEWKPDSVVRLDLIDGRIIGITDYAHCPWVVPAARSIVVPEPSP